MLQLTTTTMTTTTPPCRIECVGAHRFLSVQRATSTPEAAHLGYAADGDRVVGSKVDDDEEAWSAFTLEFHPDNTALAQLRFYRRHRPSVCTRDAFLQHRPVDMLCNNTVPLVLAPDDQGVKLVDQRTAGDATWCFVRRGQSTSENGCYDRVAFEFLVPSSSSSLSPSTPRHVFLRYRRQQRAFYIEEVAADEFTRDACFEVLAMDDAIFHPHILRKTLFRTTSLARDALLPIDAADILAERILDGESNMRAHKETIAPDAVVVVAAPPTKDTLTARRATERTQTTQTTLLLLLLASTLLLAYLIGRIPAPPSTTAASLPPPPMPTLPQ